MVWYPWRKLFNVLSFISLRVFLRPSKYLPCSRFNRRGPLTRLLLSLMYPTTSLLFIWFDLYTLPVPSFLQGTISVFWLGPWPTMYFHVYITMHQLHQVLLRSFILVISIFYRIDAGGKGQLYVFWLSNFSGFTQWRSCTLQTRILLYCNIPFQGGQISMARKSAKIIHSQHINLTSKLRGTTKITWTLTSGVQT